MNRFLLFFLCLSLSALGQAPTPSPLRVEQLRVEYKTNPVGIDAFLPRFSWKLFSTERNTLQKSYQIQVSKDDKFSKKGLIWQSGDVISDASHLIDYQGPNLQSRQRYFWKVKVVDNYGNVAESAISFFEMGLLASSDWQAKWIEPEKEGIDFKKQQPASLLRKEFTTKPKGKIASARLYVTSRGLNEMYINGQRIGKDVLSPGWTAYQARIQYFTYNVTAFIEAGNNAIGAMLGDGWYRGYLVWENNRNVWGERVALMSQLVIKYEDGTEQIIGTDETWKATNNGPVRENDLYNGETYDARLEKKGWAAIGFDESSWWNVRVGNYPKDNLIAPAGPPVRRTQELKPLKVITTPAGETVYDFGQNMVGWVRLRVQGPAGTKIRITHAEVLDQKGNFYTANLRSAKCELTYILKGDSIETYEPRFTFMGFRYARIEGLPSAPSLDNLTGVVIHSDFPNSGTFETSKPLVNQLQKNIVWGQIGNFVDVPTDCPQRDERLGWTGDAQAFVRTATFNKEVAGFFTKWLRDVAIDQKTNGGVPHVVPDVIQNKNPDDIKSSAGWADVATIAPWTLYQVYSDRRLLETQYESMKKWVEYVRKNAGSKLLWTNGEHFGDWLSYRGAAQFGEPVTDNDFIATAFFAHSAHLTSKAALTLGKATDAVLYGELYQNIKKAFLQEYVSPSGRLVCNTQTAYVLALHFDLLPENLRPQAVERLVQDIKRHGNHLTTGFLGTPYLCHVLTRFGKNDVAYDLLNQETYPSWLYPVKKGATTIWERWDGIKPDGSFQDVSMNSYNHYAYGAIGDWMYQNMAGIDLIEPGFKKFVIAPKPGGGFTSTKATYESPYGTIASSWEQQNGKTTLKISVPANSKALVKLPAIGADKLNQIAQTQRLKLVEGALEVGSGEYLFEW